MYPDLSFWLLKLRLTQGNGLYLNSVASGEDPSRLPQEVASVLEERGLVRIVLLGRTRSKAVLTAAGCLLADEVHQRTYPPKTDRDSLQGKEQIKPMRRHLRLIPMSSADA